ncbi:hypothetical protein [Bacillus rhizoplanae]|uniref:hypothetical protein n=1 Tax=Bacillus rhizoplanae TaxID=2880966 RepID=UPI003D1CD099
MARKSIVFDEQELHEIIQLRLKELNGNHLKLTYNSVFQLNKQLVKEKEIRANGVPFKAYSQDFWSKEYRGSPYRGKELIDEMKNKTLIEVADGSFGKDFVDIAKLVDDYHTNPQQLAKKIMQIMEKDRKSIKELNKENVELSKEKQKLQEEIEQLQKGIITLFHHSKSHKTSLVNVMNMGKTADPVVKDVLMSMFAGDMTLLYDFNDNETKKEEMKVVPLKENSSSSIADDYGF